MPLDVHLEMFLAEQVCGVIEHLACDSSGHVMRSVQDEECDKNNLFDSQTWPYSKDGHDGSGGHQD